MVIFQPTSNVHDAFALDFTTRIWMTYRKEFEEFIGTNVNTDCGWGCMIRSGQMLVANTLILQRFGRSWRWRGKEQVMTSDDLEVG